MLETKRNVIRGGCLCGATRYEGIGEPYNVTHCHCEDCRKSAGAPFVTWASFGRTIFNLQRENRVKSHGPGVSARSARRAAAR